MQMIANSFTHSRGMLPAIGSSRGDNILMQPQRVLIVDDNRDAAISLSVLMSLTGSDTTTAFDGLEAVETAADFDPDVVLLDIGLPKLNGYEVCRLLRQMPRTRPLVVVALTGWGQDQDRQRSQEAGFDAHLVKPVDPDALLRTLRQLTR